MHIILAIHPIDRNANTGRYVQGVPRNFNGHRDCLEDFLSDECGILGMRNLGEQNNELVTAEARDRVFHPHTASEPGGHLFQQQIAHVVPKRIVDGLEVIQVEKYDGQRVLVALGPGQRLVQAIQ